MAAVSPHHHPSLSHIFIVVLFVLSGGHPGGVNSFKVLEGGVASLSCHYSVKRSGLSRVCWGRGCGTFWCSNIVVQTDQNGIVSKVEDRYRLTGDILDGQMDLDILNVRRTDSGLYCCRVDVDGIFNDKKVIMNLRVIKAPATSSPTTTTTTSITPTTTVSQAAGPYTSTENVETSLSPEVDLRNNATMLRSDAATVDDSLSSVSLQVNVPVLSLSILLLFIFAVVFLVLVFKGGVYRRALSSSWLSVMCSSCSFSSEEFPHIIYEIRRRRGVQENIYTLD
ncbi:T-cell immunoglobulin and mucin domain-containing protein 4 isoform X2 [Cynoglossus semilaevis]|uniref:T-cell immunoglobulin and mucin domain-containing protein 4 isoform X2 n=1 Tax=Cynoglossus semilaevis TaxID=244447 RepID=UPI000496F0AD|nr:hepatitis A virus cellular receptor 1 homolog isoform X2 [Cynoglossus semilaevis]